MYYGSDPTLNNIGAVGFVSSISSLGAADASQQVNIVAIPGTALNKTKEEGVGQINLGLREPIFTSTQVNPPDGVSVCFNSGGTDQSALVIIGAGGRLSSVEMKIRDGMCP